MRLIGLDGIAFHARHPQFTGQTSLRNYAPAGVQRPRSLIAVADLASYELVIEIEATAAG